MRFLFKSSPAPLIIVAAFIARIGNSAPTVEELLAAVPRAITGPYYEDPNWDFTSWRVASLIGAGSEKMSISFRAVFAHTRVVSGGDFLVVGGYFLHDSKSGTFSPTVKVIESSRPDVLPGGKWAFSYVDKEANPSGGAELRVAYWTWTQDPPSIPAPQPVVRVPRGVEAGLELNYAVARSLRGKESMATRSLLLRQRKLLREALSSAN